MRGITAVVFDLGGVLVDWNPRHLYRKLFDDAAAMEDFLSRVCTPEWHGEADRGRSMAEGIALLCRQYPDMAPLIQAYDARWPEMFNGAIEGTVAIVNELKAAGCPLYALSNFPAEKFDEFEKVFDFIDAFDGILVSGREKLVKPDPRIYRLLLDRFGLRAEETVFVDDMPVNVEAARGIGLHAIRFQSPEQLRGDLHRLGLTEDKGHE